jgi:hypothetical protein
MCSPTFMNTRHQFSFYEAEDDKTAKPHKMRELVAMIAVPYQCARK